MEELLIFIVFLPVLEQLIPLSALLPPVVSHALLIVEYCIDCAEGAAILTVFTLRAGARVELLFLVRECDMTELFLLTACDMIEPLFLLTASDRVDLLFIASGCVTITGLVN